jgi:hypothetical protein
VEAKNPFSRNNSKMELYGDRCRLKTSDITRIRKCAREIPRQIFASGFGLNLQYRDRENPVKMSVGYIKSATSPSTPMRPTAGISQCVKKALAKAKAIPARYIVLLDLVSKKPMIAPVIMVDRVPIQRISMKCEVLFI